MNDAPPKNRPWFQLHLSTCVVLMFVAGLVTWANIEGLGDNGWISSRARDFKNPQIEKFGWPELVSYDIRDAEDSSLGSTTKEFMWNDNGLAINCLLCLAVLGVSGFSCEYLIRRRTHERQSEPASD